MAKRRAHDTATDRNPHEQAAGNGARPRRVPFRTRRGPRDGRRRARNLLLPGPVQPLQRGRQDPQAQGSLRHQHQEPRRRHPRRRPVHRRPVPAPSRRRAQAGPASRPAAPSKSRAPSPTPSAIADSKQVQDYLQDLRHRPGDQPPRVPDRRARPDGRASRARVVRPGRGARKTSGETRPRHPRAHGRQLTASSSPSSSTRACLHNAPLANPKDVAWFLASYARDALFRVEQQKELPALQTVRSALEEALGMKFTGEKGEHFFRSTLVQTLFYGVFSAWVRGTRTTRPARAVRLANGRVVAARAVHPDAVRPGGRRRSQLGPLGLVEVLDWAAGALNRVDRAEFFEKLRGRARRPVLLRAVPGSLRPRAAQGSSASGTPRRRSSSTRSPAWIASCARNSTCPTAWPTRTSSSSTPAAARGRIWSRCSHSIAAHAARQGRRRPGRGRPEATRR